MAYTIELLNFEGPLHLLLQLIEQQEMDITEIALASVTSQYLEHIGKLKDLNPAELNQFIELAARLIHIKSQALLPSLEEPDYQEDLQELTQQLEEYKRYQKASRYLEQLIKQGQPAWSRQGTKPVLNPELIDLPSVAPNDLQAAFEAALARMPALPERQIDSQLTLNQAIEQLQSAVTTQRELRLQDMVQTAASRVEAVVLFLGLLELLRLGRIRVRQDSAFGDIILIDG